MFSFLKWTSEDVPDLSDKVAIVTGANSGIGFAITSILASKNANVILACRSSTKAVESINKIKKKYDYALIDHIEVDLSNLSTIKDFTDSFKKKYKKLDILINNAGVMKTPFKQTIDGFELQFATNHLGHFALTGRLLDLLISTPQSRIVTLSSGGHKFAKIDFDNLQGEKKYNAQQAYGQSKLANLLFTYELQRHLEENGRTTIAVASHPGWTATNLQKHWLLLRLLNPILGQRPDKGCLPSLYAATAPDVKGGDYYGPSGMMELRGYPKKVQSSKLSHNFELAKKLWEKSEDLTKINFIF